MEMIEATYVDEGLERRIRRTSRTDPDTVHYTTVVRVFVEHSRSLLPRESLIWIAFHENRRSPWIQEMLGEIHSY